MSSLKSMPLNDESLHHMKAEVATFQDTDNKPNAVGNDDADVCKNVLDAFCTAGATP